ncbi:starch phosphorylase [Apostasia shenzhenica]|uniref:ACT domain-containing protein ACR n=1 Tax=Apostasia shenzhenica TaxID=1088818 RepID=A0A2I0AH32_9ASPA|nr:starch phosphorylase [Apostasia shenzhenica]
MMGCGSPSTEVEDEYEKLVMRMNPPRVSIDNKTSKKATLIKVDSANKHGSLLEVVQVLIDLNLTIKKAYISSDGEWFMDVFHVVDQEGNKLYDSEVIDLIQQSLGSRAFNIHSLRQSVGIQAALKHTSIELIGRDRPGLLSEIFAVLTDLKCNIVAAEVWTHNSRMASVIYITDEATGGPIEDIDRLAKIKKLLRFVLKGNKEKQTAKTDISMGMTHTERRLHQMMYDDRDYDRGRSIAEEVRNDRIKPVVTLENCVDRGYTVVYVRSEDRPKLLFDTVCTLTDMQYVVFHATVISEEPEAYQEYYIKHMDGNPVSSEGEKQRLIHCLEAAIRRRSTEGLRLELCSEDRIGLLSDTTRIFRENGLSVIRAEVSTRGSKAVNVFYVTDASGNHVESKAIEAVRNEIGESVLCVKDAVLFKSSSSHNSGRFSLGNLFRSRSEKFLYNLGLIRSFS